MSERPRTREELYERIRESSSEQVQLEDMVRLGFWPRQRGVPEDPVAEVQRRGELVRRLRALQKEQRRMQNIEAALKEVRRRRMKAARERRAETKARRIQAREEKARAWSRRKQREILFLGPGVSGGLNQLHCDVGRLQRQGLPVFETMEGLAGAMGITVPSLRFLAFNRKVSSQRHYVQFTVPKKTGGVRSISAPMPRLKQAQRWVLDTLLTPVMAHEAAHGFRVGRSIVSNATPHVGADVVINVDLKDFFPTVGYRRVRGLFIALGYSEAVATTLALICTEPETQAVELDGKTWYVALGERHLPQGAPSSPAITNLLCRKMDRRLHGLAHRYGFVYTRYADDLTLSARGAGQADVGLVLRCLRQIVTDEGFVVHPSKTRVLRRGSRQEVTGIVVNDKLSVERKTLRRFRATLFQIEKDGPEGKTWGDPATELFASLQGFADFVTMVDSSRGEPLRAKVAQLKARYAPSRAPSAARPAPTQSSPGQPNPALSSSGQSSPGLPDQQAKPEQAAPQTSDDLSDLIRQFSDEPASTEDKPASTEGEGGASDKKWWKLF